MKHERYVVVDSRSTVGNSVFFWCFDGNGYTVDLRMAALYTEEEAREICKHRTTDKMYKYSDMWRLVQFHVDMQDLRHDPLPTKPHVYSHIEVTDHKGRRTKVEKARKKCEQSDLPSIG